MPKKSFYWLKAAILVCGAMTALTSCSNDDNAEEQEQAYTGVPLVIYLRPQIAQMTQIISLGLFRIKRIASAALSEKSNINQINS